MQRSFSGTGLRARREAAGLSRYQLACAVGLSAQMVALWERERSKPSADTLACLAAVFGASIDDFFAEVPA